MRKENIMLIPNLILNSLNNKSMYGNLSAVEQVHKQNDLIFLRRNDINKLTHSDILVVMAHPDDETLFGFIAGLIKGGQSVQLVYATSGDQGQDKRGILHKGKELAEQREKELLDALTKLGITKPPIMLDFKDGDISLPANKNYLSFYINKIVEKTSPNAVFSFGPDGVSNHPDHTAIGKLSHNSVQQYNNSHWYGARTRFYEIGFSNSSVRDFKNIMDSVTNAWDDMQPMSALSLKVNIKPQVEQVVSAISSHNTQFNQGEINGFYSYFSKYPYVEIKEVLEN